jgi:exopolyphosphatase/guanosine-5'-triphosphate,3'-diphosphate pyrophosphatase
MRVGVIDVGSNTVRLLVAEQGPGGPERVREARTYLGLGAEIAVTGRIRRKKLSQTAREVRRFLRIAGEHGAAETDVLVTAPGRQAANADELHATLSRATGRAVQVLTSEEEGRLAYEGALARTRPGAGPVAVCDVGGGSTEITVGEPGGGPSWTRSIDVGALRLTAAVLRKDPPSAAQIAAARALVAEQLDAIVLPEVGSALVVGGSARALARLEGRLLDEAALEGALELAASRPAAKVARATGLEPERAATLAGGAIVLLGLARRLGRPLELAGGGLREGAVARLLSAAEAA